ncbi:MAG: 16S rRNA (uracil(1498)-N(3))-methyltransferase [Flavobacteriales bacterium]
MGAAIPLLYVPDVSANELWLPEEEAWHALKVLRLEEGAELRIVDGQGGIYKARIITRSKNACQVRVEESSQSEGERNFRLTMAVAPTKNYQRFEWFLEKATEMGVDRIIPLITARSERSKIKPKRSERILIAAMKQSKKAFLPELQLPLPLSHLLEEALEGQGLVAHCYKTPERSPLQKLYRKGENALVIVGPEGDLTPDEVQMTIEKGYEPVSLGDAVLRTETAAVAACHTINLLNGT